MSKVPLDRVFDAMEKGGVIGCAAEDYYHMEYLNETPVKNPNKKWWQFWKPSTVWRKKMKKTVVFDFDGVIHSYTSGWFSAEYIPDPPVPGIESALKEIHNAGYEIVVVSTRCATPEGLDAILEWLDLHDLGPYVDKVCKEKPPAIVYIDDRAICFDGHPENLLEKINSFQPWNKKERNK